MKISNKILKKFQEGGQMAAEAPVEQAPAGGEQDPLMQLGQMAMQALQGQDCQMMAQVCEGFVQLLQSAQGGQPEQEAPVYGKGGKIVNRR